MRGCRSARIAVVVLAVLAGCGPGPVPAAQGGGTEQGDADAKPSATVAIPPVDSAVSSVVDVVFNPPAVIQLGSTLTVPLIVACSTTAGVPSDDGPDCIRGVTLVSETSRTPVSFDPSSGYLVTVRDRGGTDVQFHLELGLASGEPLRLPSDGEYRVVVAQPDTTRSVILPDDGTVAGARMEVRLAWGDGEGKLGNVVGVEGESYGSSGFAVLESGAVVVGDPIHERVLIADAVGAAVGTFVVGFGAVIPDEGTGGAVLLGADTMMQVDDLGAADEPQAVPEALVTTSLPSGQFAASDGALFVQDYGVGTWLELGATTVDHPEQGFAFLPEGLGPRVVVELRSGTLMISAVESDRGSEVWRIDVPGGPASVLAVRVLDDGDLLAVVDPIEADAEHLWVMKLGRDRSSAMLIDSSWDFLPNGPQIQIALDGVYVLSGDEDGVVIRGYDLDQMMEVESK